MPSIFLSHSSGDGLVGRIRDKLYDKLTAQGFEVLLDRELLSGGMEWRPALHRWLGECDGAVILFSQAALDSAWVLKESTILTWRRSLGSKVKVLPVLVGCRREQVVEHRAFKPLDLGSLQFLRFDETAPREQANKMLIDALIGELASLQPDASDAPLRAWIRDVALLLSKVDPADHLKDAARVLDIDADARSRFEELQLRSPTNCCMSACRKPRGLSSCFARAWTRSGSNGSWGWSFRHGFRSRRLRTYSMFSVDHRV